tara:strand:- start:367 stop:645 length:279 start_codon:yes stop_codon:yes gene_type:complete
MRPDGWLVGATGNRDSEREAEQTYAGSAVLTVFISSPQDVRIIALSMATIVSGVGVRGVRGRLATVSELTDRSRPWSSFIEAMVVSDIRTLW